MENREGKRGTGGPKRTWYPVRLGPGTWFILGHLRSLAETSDE